MQEDDGVVFNRFLAGSDRDFLELFRRHNRKLHTYCLKIVGNRQVAEDLMQEMWERVIRLRRKPIQIDSPRGFCLRVLRNLCIDNLRTRKESLSLNDLQESEHPSYLLNEPSEIEELALQSMEALPFNYREVLILNLFCGYQFEEIAEMLDKTPESIWTRASRARARLRAIIAKELKSRSRTL